MKAAYHQYIRQKGHSPRLTGAVEDAAARHKEECELRLARIQNGKEPGYKNGESYTKAS